MLTTKDTRITRARTIRNTKSRAARHETDHIAMHKGSALKKQHDSPLSGGQLASAHHSRREWRFALACGVSAAPPVQTEADFLPPQPVFRYTVDSDGPARRTRERPARGASRRQLFNPPLKSGLTSPLLDKHQSHCFKGASNYEDSSSS
jgi:hypothetical protein